MSLHLLPVKTGREQFPVRYRNIHAVSQNWISLIACENNKILYLFAQASWDNYNPTVYDGKTRLYKMNLLTSEIELIGEQPWNRYTDNNNYSSIGGMLVDDHYIYIATKYYSYLYRFTKNTFTYVDYFSSPKDFSAHAKMTWKDERTIIFACENGYLLFDTIDCVFTPVNTGVTYNPYDIACGKKFFMMTKNTNYAYVVRLSDHSGFNLSLPNSSYAACTYKDGKFYIADNQMLCIYDEETETMEQQIAVAWTAPRTIEYTNGAVFVTCNDSTNNRYRRLYIYNIELQDYRYIVLPWQVPTRNRDNCFIPTVFEGFWFGIYNTLAIIDYSGNSKYNFGYKYQSFNLMFNSSEKDQFEYDPRFIEFTETYMTMKDGDIRYPLTAVGDSSHIKSAQIHKSDYKQIHSVSLKFVEGSDVSEQSSDTNSTG